MQGAQESSKENNIHLVYKNLGETPLEAIQSFKSKNAEYADLPITYAGRLDPMAEGLLILLSGKKVMEKEKYLELPKIYEAEILWGFSTDTSDLLGMVTERSFTDIDEDKIRIEIQNSVGKFEQAYPVYSSKSVNGKSLFEWAREGRLFEIDVPKHEVELINAEFVSRRIISKNELEIEIDRKISLVKGDFRQKEILEKWKQVLEKKVSQEFFIDKLNIEVSSGFYVRQFTSDLAKKLGTQATTFHIKRSRIGDYEI